MQRSRPPSSRTAATPKTVDCFRRELEANNVSIAAWARQAKLPVAVVRDVMRKRTQGKRGAARKVLVAMGVKPPSMFGAAK